MANLIKGTNSVVPKSCYPVVAMWPFYKDQEKIKAISLSMYLENDDCDMLAFWPDYQS